METWHRNKHFGNGGGGDVLKETCAHGPHARQCRAVKQITKQPDVMRMLARELGILVALSTNANQPEYLWHFVQFEGWFQDDHYVYIAMEYVSEGDLQGCIDKGEAFPEHETVNILVARPGPDWHVKITDFGISKNVEGTSLKTKGGTKSYMAPERFDSGPHSSRDYTSAVDIWSLGAVAYCIQTGTPPFTRLGDIFMFKENNKEFPLEPILFTSGAFMHFIQSLMVRQPDSRPTIDKVLGHPWIRSMGRIAAPAWRAA